MENPETPETFGPAWDRMIRIITEDAYKPLPALLISANRWRRVLKKATEEERLVLEAMVSKGQVIISTHLPNDEVAYRFAPRTPFPRYDIPGVHVNVQGPEDRMTDAIRRAAGGPGSGMRS
jgi:hypothetical protein